MTYATLFARVAAASLLMSAMAPTADIRQRFINVGFVPEPDVTPAIRTGRNLNPHLIAGITTDDFSSAE